MLLTALLALCLVVGCGHPLDGVYQPALPVPEPAGTLLVGGSRVDITPSPGMAMGGFSWLGARARGHWLRLQARAVVVEAPDGSSLALVATDLWSLPAALVSHVAARLQLQHPDVPLRRAQLLIGASHSHHSPGNISPDRFFGFFGQDRIGFHEAYFDWVAERLATAIARAWRVRKPATMTFETHVLEDVVRNRSLEPFLANPDAQEVMDENPDATCELGVHERPEVCAAVDRRLRKFHFRDSASQTIAMVAAAAMHPTAIGTQQTVYSSDVFGAAANLAERELGRRGGNPVVALFNGAEGDVSSTWSLRRDRNDVKRIAGGIAAGLLDSSDSMPESPATIEIRRGPLDLSSTCTRDESSCTSYFGYPGWPTLAGAEDGPSNVPILKEGLRRWFSWGRQGRKTPALAVVAGPVTLLPIPLIPATQIAASTLWNTPDEVELGIFRLGDRILVSLPGEFTTLVGRRIAKAVAESFGADWEAVTLMGLADGFAYYTATPEEFDQQHYEGSGTLYGRAQGALYVDGFAALAATSPLAPDPDPDDVEYHENTQGRIDDDLRAIQQEACEVDEGLRAALGNGIVYRASFRDDLIPTKAWAGRERLAPRFHVETLEVGGDTRQPLRVDGLVEDDSAGRIVATASPDGSDGADWCVFWVPDVSPPPAGEIHLCISPAGTGPSRCMEARRVEAGDLFAGTS